MKEFAHFLREGGLAGIARGVRKIGILRETASRKIFPYPAPILNRQWTAVDTCSCHLFWGRVLALKFLVSMTGVRAVHRTTNCLNMATPEHQPVDEIETDGHGATVGRAFLLDLTDTQFCAVLGCSPLWIAATVDKRFKHSRSQIGTEVTCEKIPLRFPRRVRWFDPGDRIHWEWPNLFWCKVVQFMRNEKIYDELWKAMVFHRRDTEV